MVVIRLQRRGTKKKPHHRIVVTEKTRAQGGRILEILGYYDPSYDPAHFQLDQSRLTFWVSEGAQVSGAVEHLVKKSKRTSVAATKR